MVEKVKDNVKTNSFTSLAKVNKIIYLKATSKDLSTYIRHLAPFFFLIRADLSKTTIYFEYHERGKGGVEDSWQGKSEMILS